MKRKIDQATIMVTTECNSRCIHCNLWCGEKKTISLDKFKELLIRLKRTYDIERVCIFGGEPFLIPNIEEYGKAVKDILGESCGVNSPTNGLMPERIKKTSEKYWDYICVSYEGEEGQEIIRRTDQELTKRTCEILPKSKGVLIIPTITKVNYKEIPQLMEFGMKYGGTVFSIYRQDDYFKNSADEKLTLKEEDNKEVIKLLKESCAGRYISNWALIRFLKGKPYPHDKEKVLFIDENLKEIKSPEGCFEPVEVLAVANKSLFWKYFWKISIILDGTYFRFLKTYRKPLSRMDKIFFRIIKGMEKKQ